MEKDISKDDHMNDWISIGTKNYAYETDRGKGLCKIKEFMVNWKNAEKLNTKTMKKVLEGEVSKVPVTYNQKVRNINS